MSAVAGDHDDQLFGGETIVFDGRCAGGALVSRIRCLSDRYGARCCVRTGNGVARCLLGTSWSSTGAGILSSIFFSSDSMLSISGDGEFDSSTSLIVGGGERLGSRDMMCRDCKFATMVPTISYCWYNVRLPNSPRERYLTTKVAKGPPRSLLKRVVFGRDAFFAAPRLNEQLASR
jgi:hypothetical protein